MSRCTSIRINQQAATLIRTACATITVSVSGNQVFYDQVAPVVHLSVNYTIPEAAVPGTLYVCEGAITVTLPDCTQMANGWHCDIKNAGDGTVTIATREGQLIDGGASATIYAMGGGGWPSVSVKTDAENYYVR